MEGDHLSRTAVADGLERRCCGGTGKLANRCPRALAETEALALLPAGVYRASTSRCCWCALTTPLHPCLFRSGFPGWPSAVYFCGTFLTVTRTGRYPAGLAIGEPGLSSTEGQLANDRTTRRS
jgi:hypothetical protein